MDALSTYLLTKTPLVYFVQSLTSNEASSYFIAKQNIIDIFNLTSWQFLPPVYYFILHVWIKLFGSSEIALRSLSLICYVGTIYLIFDILTEVYKINKQRSGWYLLLFLINPLFSYYGFIVEPYAMAIFFTTLSFYALATKKNLLYIVAITLGLYTHNSVFFILISQILWKIASLKHTKHILSNLKMFILPSLIYLPWAMIMMRDGLLPLFQNNILRDFLYIPTQMYVGYNIIHTSAYVNLTLILLTILIMGGIHIWLTRTKHTFIDLLSISLWAFFPPLILKSLVGQQSLAVSTVGFIIILIYILQHFPIALRYIALFLLVFFTLQYQQAHIHSVGRSNLTQTIQEIKTLTESNDLIYVTDSSTLYTAQYYFGEKNVYFYNTAEPILSETIVLPLAQKKIVHQLPPFPKKAIILKKDYSYEVLSQL